MASMSGIILGVCRDDTRLLHKVITVIVSGISIAVIILGRAPYFILIHPHAGLEVRMGHIHTFVKNCNDYRRIAIASEFSPCLLNLDISILDKLGRTEVSVIDKMPLIGKQRVIECRRRCLCRQLTHLLCSQRHSLAFTGSLQGAVELDPAHLAQLR